MKTTLFTLIAFLFLFLKVSFAQLPDHIRGSEYCRNHKLSMDEKAFLSLKSAGSPVHSFDVLQYSLELDLMNNFSTPYPASFSAKENITFRVDSTLNQIVLNAVNTSITIDSVSLAGTSFSHSTDLLTIHLDRTYSPGEIAEVRIAYQHNNTNDGAIYVSGGFFFTDCEPEGARKWFPCYDRPSDKAKVNLTAKVPSTVKLGSNGHLQDSIPGTGSITYHWVSRDPVATYLVVISAKVNYNLDIVNWENPNTGEIIPFRFYYNNGEDPVPMENIIGEMTTFYSQEFGDHPFEKNGFATLNNQFAWGGMENQTLTSLCPGCWDEWLMAHEFAHQWFGDMITCATWADIFLNEGFATWSEAHWTEHAYGYASYKSEMDGNAQYYRSYNPGWAISDPDWITNTPSVNTLFNYAITYMKGSCVLHQLRYVLGDSLFFAGIKGYATDTVNFKYKSATIPDFKDKMEAITGQELDWFFDEWIYHPNHPSYKNVYAIRQLEGEKWNVTFTAKQAQGAIFYWQMPLELKIRFTDLSDTTIRVFNSYNDQIFNFEFAKQPVSLQFDSNDDILLKTGYTIVGEPDAKESTLGLRVAPSPATSDVNVMFNLSQPSDVLVEVFNESGGRIYKKNLGVLLTGEQTFLIPSSRYSPGNYTIKVTTSETKATARFVRM